MATNDPDVQRMLAVQAGDRAAFQELYRKYARKIVRYAMRFVTSQARAEELAQDVFLQAFRARASYRPEARFSTWLYRIATNACLSEVRRPEHRAQTDSLDDADSESPRELADERAAEGESAAMRREIQRRVQSLLADLPEQQRAALLLARVEGLSYEEVASSLECSVSAVKSLIHRATLAMRDGMSEDRE